MKTIKICLLALISTITACTNDSIQQSVNEKNEYGATPHYVSYEQALSDAIDFMSQDSAVTRSVDSYKVATHYEYSANSKTRTANSDTIDVRFHVINFADNSGFALVAADDRTTPVYAYSYDGNLDIDDAIENTGFAEFIENAIVNYKIDVENSEKEPKSRLDPDPDYNYWVTHLPTGYYNGVLYYKDSYFTTIASKAAMLTTAWAQCDPYNYYCPTYLSGNPDYNGRTATGCAPIAMAQIMAYHENPTHYVSQYGIEPFPWSTIKSQSTYSVGDYSNNILLVATLISQIQAYASVYYDIKTGWAASYIDAVKYAFECLNYSTSNIYTGYYGVPGDSLQLSLNNNRPVFASGYSLVGNNGHAWVIDGYRYEQQVTKYYNMTYPYALAHTSYNLCYKPYYHCNWGWGGDYNAFVLNFSYDGNVSNRYTVNNAFLHNIHPN